VPVITLLGQEHRSRVSAAILNSVGLSGCVASTPEEYIEKAITLSHNIDFLNFWRAKHKTQMEQSKLMAYEEKTKNIEQIYQKIYDGDL
jgi:predicted O-linked N-acetylglucosamine transferase (SPINDLY family)